MKPAVLYLEGPCRQLADGFNNEPIVSISMVMTGVDEVFISLI